MKLDSELDLGARGGRPATDLFEGDDDPARASSSSARLRLLLADEEERGGGGGSMGDGLDIGSNHVMDFRVRLTLALRMREGGIGWIDLVVLWCCGIVVLWCWEL